MRPSFYDFLIIGQGLAGTILANELIERNKRVLVIDKKKANSSSNVAAGLINPITGRRIVKGWMYEECFPVAKDVYSILENKFSKKYLIEKPLAEIVNDVKTVNSWSERSSDPGIEKYILKESFPRAIYDDKISEYKKAILLDGGGWLNISEILNDCRGELLKNNHLLDEEFSNEELKQESGRYRYKLIEAEKIIFCEGFKSMENPLWKMVKMVPSKGEILTIDCKALPEEYILMSGIFIIPLGHHRFRIGSTYEWDFMDELPSESGKLKLIKELDRFLKIPYTIIEHKAGVRPTIKDRRPVIGEHPFKKNFYTFNGMGTKGSLLIPYFSKIMADYLENKNSIPDEVNVNRFINQ